MDIAIVKKFLDDNENLKFGLIAWGIIITILFKVSSIKMFAEAVLYFGSLYLIGSYLVVVYYFEKLMKDHPVLEVPLYISQT